MSFSASVSELVERSESPLIAAATSWSRVPLGQLVKILNGAPWKSEYFNEGRGVPLIRIRDVTTGATNTFYSGPIDDDYWVERGDVLIGMDGDFNVRVWNSERGLLNQRVCKITPNDTRLLKGYLAYVLPGYLKLINDETHSVTVKHLSSKTIAEIPIPLPPLAEQLRIVAKLDSLRARSARARHELDRIPQLIEHYRQALLAKAFSSEMTKDWRAAHNVQVEWVSGTVGALAKEIRYGTAAKCTYEKTETAVLRIPNIGKDGILLDDLKYAEFTKAEIAKLSLLEGDLLFIRSNGSLGLVGRAAMVTSREVGLLYAGYLIRVRLDQQRIVPRFLLHLFSEPKTRAHIETLAKSTSGVNNINSEQLSAVTVPLPSRAEQVEIVRRLDHAFAWLDKVAAEHARADRLLPKLGQAILAKAFRGELVPQDPNDEPASVLLDRIRGGQVSVARPARRGRRE